MEEIEETSRIVNVRLPADLHRELRVKAAQEDTNLRALTERLLRQALAGDRAAA